MELISSMNRQLSELNTFFSTSTSTFIQKINMHQARFTRQDFKDFENLIQQIKAEVNQKISNFFSEKFQIHSQDYQEKINKYTQNAEQSQFQLFSFRTELEKHTMALKQDEERKQVILDHFSKKFYLNSLRKKYLQGLKKNVEINKQQGAAMSEAAKIYRKNLMKRAFFPWRSCTYKQGHQNKTLQQTQFDIQNIHSQYSSIINILKQKIIDTEELIKLKKAAKGQFSYALSKNLMKTISNLSLEVMSLNQMSLKDQECGRSKQNEKLLRQVDKIIEEKINKVNQYKENLLGQRQQKERQRKIRFI